MPICSSPPLHGTYIMTKLSRTADAAVMYGGASTGTILMYAMLPWRHRVYIDVSCRLILATANVPF